MPRRRGGETGRRTGLKILGRESGVRVRPPPPAPSLMTLADFWSRADRLTRASFLTAAAVASIHLGTFVGLASVGAARLLYIFHLIVMALMGAVFLRTYRHHYAVLRRTETELRRWSAP